MLFSYKKLCKIANLKNISVKQMCYALNSIGFEVENYSQWIQPNKVYVGKIVKKEKHPNADKLFVLKISNNKNLRTIVTSALVNKDDIVAYFAPGAIINKNKLGSVNFFGVKSNGMLCSPSELGIHKSLIPDYWSDILTFKDEKLIGKNLFECLDFNDYLIDTKILSNRSDAICYNILSLELSTYFQTSFSFQNFKIKSPTFKSHIQIKNGLANHFSGFEVKVNDIEKSSIEDELILIKSNIKPINKIVDLTSLAAIYWNQPCHAYDLDKIGQNLTVKLASGENLLLNNEIKKFENVISIVDENNAICLAGIMGFVNTSISDSTKNIFFEVANFDPKLIREGMKKTGINSESSTRFSKKMNPNIIENVIEFIKSNFQNFSQTINTHKMQIKNIVFDSKMVNLYTYNNFINTKYYKDAFVKINKLGFVKKGSKIMVPFYRHDIENTEDIIEELLRQTSYNILKPEQPYFLTNNIFTKEFSFANSFVVNGFNQVRSYSLVNNKNIEFNPFGFKNKIKLETFASNDKIFYRNSIIPSLLEIAIYNQKRKIEQIAIFEEGKVHGEQENYLGFVSNNHSYLQLHQTIQNIFSEFGRLTFEKHEYELLHKGVSAVIKLNNVVIGYIGKINPKFLNCEFWICEISLNELRKNKNPIQIFKNYFKDSYIKRDFTFNTNVVKYNKIYNLLDDLDTIDNFFVIDQYQKNDQQMTTFRIEFIKNENTTKQIQSVESFITKNWN